MAKKKDDQVLLDYLSEHIAYERMMLEHAFNKLHVTPEGLDWNSYYESFCVHARNLFIFLRNGTNDKTNHRALDYVETKKVDPDHSLNEMDTFVFHVSTGRSDRRKFDMERIIKFGAVIDNAWSAWAKKLGPPFADVVSPDPVCKPRSFECGVTPATACSAVTATTFSAPKPLTPSADGIITISSDPKA